jgi:porin
MRFGQLAAESEFAVPNTAFNLVNGTFDWLLSLAEALPAGGLAYPLPLRCASGGG